MAFDSLQQVLGGIEKRTEWRSRHQFQQLLDRWPGLVGPAVAAQTRPVAIRRDVLQVATSSFVWAQNLMFERQRLLQKINACLPLSLTDIRFSTVEWHRSPDSNRIDSESSRLWQDHPSQVAAPASVLPAQSPADPQTAFQQWARAIQARSHPLPLCPQCQCPTPPGELQRWFVCALCATQRWRSRTATDPE